MFERIAHMSLSRVLLLVLLSETLNIEELEEILKGGEEYVQIEYVVNDDVIKHTHILLGDSLDDLRDDLGLFNSITMERKEYAEHLLYLASL